MDFSGIHGHGHIITLDRIIKIYKCSVSIAIATLPKYHKTELDLHCLSGFANDVFLIYRKTALLMNKVYHIFEKNARGSYIMIQIKFPVELEKIIAKQLRGNAFFAFCMQDEKTKKRPKVAKFR